MNGQWRGLWLCAIALVLVLAGLAVVLGIGKIVGWLAAAILAGAAATIAGLVQGAAKKRLAKGKALLAGTPPPITVSTEYWQAPLHFVSGANSRVVRCGYVILLVQTTAEQAVVLQRMRAIIDSRIPGSFIPPDHSHAPLTMRRFLLDLDDDFPELRPERFTAPPTSIMDTYHVATPEFPYTVTPHDPENFQVMAYTDRNDVMWHLALDWVCGTRTGTLIINNNGQPFRVAQPRDENQARY